MKVTLRNLIGFLLLLTILATSLTPNTAALAKGYPGNNRTAVTIPTAVSPTGIITDTTPTFKWTRVTGTTKYQFRLYKGASTTPLWTKVVLTSACGSSTLYCTQTPTTPLALANYKWQVRVYATGSAWSALKSFTITNKPSSFNSQFTGSMTGWKTIGVIPWHVSPSALFTSGTERKCANVYRTSSLAFMNLDYSAKMKCTSSEYCENYLAIRMGQSINPVNNCWRPGYLFGYDSNGYYAIWKAIPTGKVDSTRRLHIQPFHKKTGLEYHPRRVNCLHLQVVR